MAPESRDDELKRLRREAAGHAGELAQARGDAQAHSDRQDALIERLREEARVDAEELDRLQALLSTAERELGDLRAVRDALTPPRLPERPGLDLAASFLPASRRVSGDFYLVAAGPDDSTVAVVGDVVGHGVEAAKRAAFVRTTFVSTAPFSDDPCRLLDWANIALVERAGVSTSFVTAVCVTYVPASRRLRWAYAGHPPLLWLDSGETLEEVKRAVPLGLDESLGCAPGSCEVERGAGVLLYTDGLTEARRDGEQFGLGRVVDCLRAREQSAPQEIVDDLRERATDFAPDDFADDLCMVAVRVI